MCGCSDQQQKHHKHQHIKHAESWLGCGLLGGRQHSADLTVGCPPGNAKAASNNHGRPNATDPSGRESAIAFGRLAAEPSHR